MIFMILLYTTIFEKRQYIVAAFAASLACVVLRYRLLKVSSINYPPSQSYRTNLSSNYIRVATKMVNSKQMLIKIMLMIRWSECVRFKSEFKQRERERVERLDRSWKWVPDLDGGGVERVVEWRSSAEDGLKVQGRELTCEMKGS